MFVLSLFQEAHSELWALQSWTQRNLVPSCAACHAEASDSPHTDAAVFRTAGTGDFSTCSGGIWDIFVKHELETISLLSNGLIPRVSMSVALSR